MRRITITMDVSSGMSPGARDLTEFWRHEAQDVLEKIASTMLHEIKAGERRRFEDARIDALVSLEGEE